MGMTHSELFCVDEAHFQLAQSKEYVTRLFLKMAQVCWKWSSGLDLNPPVLHSLSTFLASTMVSAIASPQDQAVEFGTTS
jgi:hypothetical protein